MKLLLASSSVFLLLLLTIATSSTNAIIYNYDPSYAMTALTYAKTAYCNATDGLANWTCPSCPLNSGFQITNVYSNTSNSFQAFSGYDPKNNLIVVSFRGTWNWKGWLVDFDTALTPVYPRWNCPGDARIHDGYFNMYSYARDQIFSDLVALVAKYPTATISSNGHSMGASLAQIFAVDAKVYFGSKKRVVVYSFGTPRTGNSLFSTCVAALFPAGDMIRINHKRDSIPLLPSRSNGYLHAVQESWWDNDLGPLNYTSLCPTETPIQESEDCINSISIWHSDPFDHLLYLGRSTRCNLEDPAVEKKILTEELQADPTFQFAVHAKKYLLDKMMKGGK